MPNVDYKNSKNILIALSVALGVFLLSFSFITTTQALLLSTISLLVILWTNEALALGVVSLLPIILFPAFGILGTKATTINYAHPIIFLFLGGFLLAIAVEKTNLHVYIADKILNIFPNTVRGIIYSLAITSGTLSSILSNTTTTLLLIPVGMFLSNDPKLKMRFVLAIAYGASIGGIITPIGTPPNLILMGIMNDKMMESIAFVEWMMMVSPLAFVMFIVVGFILGLGVENSSIERKFESKKLDIKQKKVIVILLSLISLLFVNSSIEPYWSGFGLSEPLLLLGAGLLFFMPYIGILEWKEDSIKVPYQIIFLFGAGFSIAAAFSSTGLADVFASYLLSLTNHSSLVLLFFIAVLITFSTEITSNTALISIMLPIIYSVTQMQGMDARLFMMVATICASYAFMLPIATPPNAIAMSSGAIEVKTMLKYGFIFNIIGIMLILIIAELFWKNIL